MEKTDELRAKEKVQKKTMRTQRFKTALFIVLVISNLYFVVDLAETNRTTRALNQQMSEVNQRWSHVVDQIQKRLDSQK